MEKFERKADLNIPVNSPKNMIVIFPPLAFEEAWTKDCIDASK